MIREQASYGFHRECDAADRTFNGALTRLGGFSTLVARQEHAKAIQAANDKFKLRVTGARRED